MKLMEKIKLAQKINKNNDIEETIAAIQERMKHGLNPQSEEYKLLQKAYQQKANELTDIQKSINGLQNDSTYCEFGTNEWKSIRSDIENEQRREKAVLEEMLKIQEKMGVPKPGSEEFDKLRKQLEQELRNKKLVKEMRFMGLSPDKILMVLVIIGIAGFGFALDTESPKALKIAQFALKLPIVKV